MKARSTTPISIALPLALVLGLAACGSGAVGNIAESDGGLDVSAPAGYSYVAIRDDEFQQATFQCSATDGPGSDIDAVALIRNGKTIGYGLIGSAKFTENTTSECASGACSGDGNCKYSSLSTAYDTANLVARTEGPPDAVVNQSTDDTGYMSLNAGALQIEIGDLYGQGTPQTIMSHDQIKVFEVDQTYKTGSNGCVCTPGHYQVFLQDQAGYNLQLAPVQFDPANAATCGATPGPSDTLGCGTTVFQVP